MKYHTPLTHLKYHTPQVSRPTNTPQISHPFITLHVSHPYITPQVSHPSIASNVKPCKHLSSITPFSLTLFKYHTSLKYHTPVTPLKYHPRTPSSITLPPPAHTHTARQATPQNFKSSVEAGDSCQMIGSRDTTTRGKNRVSLTKLSTSTQCKQSVDEANLALITN